MGRGVPPRLIPELLNKGKRGAGSHSRRTKFEERAQELTDKLFNVAPFSKKPAPAFSSPPLALALPSPSGSANLDALALSPGVLRLRRRSARVFVHALIAHPGEEQDLSAAVTRSHATGTGRGPKLDDIVHCGPR